MTIDLDEWERWLANGPFVRTPEGAELIRLAREGLAARRRKCVERCGLCLATKVNEGDDWSFADWEVRHDTGATR